MPPISCTSKWRILSVRLDASRTTAKASFSSWSSVSPPAKRFLNSPVLARSSSSVSFANEGSSALICATAWEYCLISRWLRLPKIRVGRLARALSIPRGKSGVTRVRARGPSNRRFYPENGVLLGARDGLGRFEELRRILRRAAVAHLEVQVRARGTAG